MNIHQGEGRRRAKLTEDQVREIRRRRADKEELSALAKEYGVSESTISRTANKRNWNHLED